MGGGFGRAGGCAGEGRWMHAVAVALLRHTYQLLPCSGVSLSIARGIRMLRPTHLTTPERRLVRQLRICNRVAGQRLVRMLPRRRNRCAPDCQAASERFCREGQRSGERGEEAHRTVEARRGRDIYSRSERRGECGQRGSSLYSVSKAFGSREGAERARGRVVGPGG